MCVITQTQLFKLYKFILRLNQLVENQMEAKLTMKKNEKINHEQMNSPSTSNKHRNPDNESTNTSQITFYEIRPFELLMNLISPTLAYPLKYHQELLKLKRSNT